MIKHTKVAGKPEPSTKLKNLKNDSPYISESDHVWTSLLMSASAGVKYPVNSGAELVRHFGGKDSSLTVDRYTFRPARLLKRFPPHNFPIVSFENFAEKLAALLATERKNVAPSVKVEQGPLGQEIEQIRAQLPSLRFPIATAAELISALEDNGPYRFRNRQFNVRVLSEVLPRSAFPIESVDALLRVAASALMKRAKSGNAGRSEHPGLKSTTSNRVAFSKRESSRTE
jgi:hypothetical protein